MSGGYRYCPAFAVGLSFRRSRMASSRGTTAWGTLGTASLQPLRHIPEALYAARPLHTPSPAPSKPAIRASWDQGERVGSCLVQTEGSPAQIQPISI